MSADNVDPIARAAFTWVAGKEACSKQTPRDFVVVTFVSSYVPVAPRVLGGGIMMMLLFNNR
jgi:hypothetical protein